MCVYLSVRVCVYICIYIKDNFYNQEYLDYKCMYYYKHFYLFSIVSLL